MSLLVADLVVHTDYGHVDLLWSREDGFDGVWQKYFAGQVNGLVGAAEPGGVFFHLGRRSGGSAVRIALHDRMPDADPSWEDVVEVSTVVSPGSAPRWVSWAGETGGTLDRLPAGTYRLRVSAVGRDAGHADEWAPRIVDSYLLEFWPEQTVRPDEIVRVGSADAAYWHHEWGEGR